MARPASRRLSTRSGKVRSNADLLQEGYGTGYGWVGNGAAWGDGQYGDWDPYGEQPVWWVGSDNDHFGDAYYPIGPNGPGDVAPYAYDKPWNRRGGHILPAVTRCTQLIVQPIVRTTWVMEDRTGQHALPLWIRDPMLLGGAPGTAEAYFPCPERMSGHSFWTTALTHALWYGMAPIIFMEDASGQPLAGTLRHLNPYMIGTHEDRWVIDPRGDTPVHTDKDGRFDMAGKTWRIVVVRGMPPHDGRTPSGVLTRHYDTLRVGAAVSKYVASTFTSGVPSGYLRALAPNTTDEEVSDLKRTWMRAHGRGSREVAVLNATTEYQPIALSPVDADVDRVHNVSLMDVAHAFGLSSAWLDVGGGSLTYANVTDRRRDLVDHTLTGWAEQLVSVLTSVLPFGSSVRVVWTGYTAPDPTQQIPTLVQAVGAGLVSLMEARALLGLTPTQEPVPPSPTLPDGTLAPALEDNMQNLIDKVAKQ